MLQNVTALVAATETEVPIPLIVLGALAVLLMALGLLGHIASWRRKSRQRKEAE